MDMCADSGEKARVAADLEVLTSQFSGHGSGELPEGLAVFDVDVEILGGVGVEG